MTSTGVSDGLDGRAPSESTPALAGKIDDTGEILEHLGGIDDYLLAAELYEVAVKIRRHDGIVQTVLLLC